ncbi:NAD(P)H-quinone oxidoreductase [Hyphococcus sp.]|uniref:NAD(P)H-quinone oxidoreductase n=1 Tax=Hyphococcus sp. TaxID=2038636 RepID=UPI002087A9C9|nr:MAG: NAD(P)H quinone oxidoreductase [Marinicaulis sp.]
MAKQSETAMTDALPANMNVIEITEPGGPEVLQLRERPVPQPKDNEVLIRIHSAGVNRPEVLQRKGLYPPPPGATDIPGLEAAGEIAAIGADVKDWRVGDKVCALLTGGGYGEYAIADAGSCLLIPDGTGMEEAAALPETVFTVWANVFDDAQLKSGETLLVHGGTSGIGAAAIGLAKAFGAKVIATAGTKEKCDAARALGADAAYLYNEEKWDDAIRESGGADVVLDMAGGDFVARNLSCMNFGGRHVSIAMLRGAEATINIFTIMRNHLRLSGSTMKARPFAEKARLAADIRTKVWPHIASGAFRPRVDATFPLAEAAKAHALMEAGGHVGKIVLKIR